MLVSCRVSAVRSSKLKMFREKSVSKLKHKKNCWNAAGGGLWWLPTAVDRVK